MKILIKALLLVAVLLLGAIGFAYSGIYDVGAASPHSGFSNWLLSTTSKASIARRAADIVRQFFGWLGVLAARHQNNVDVDLLGVNGIRPD